MLIILILFGGLFCQELVERLIIVAVVLVEEHVWDSHFEREVGRFFI